MTIDQLSRLADHIAVTDALAAQPELDFDYRDAEEYVYVPSFVVVR